MRALDNSSVGSYIRLFRQSNRRFIAQIIQVVETAAYRRMLVRIQLERLSFVSEMIYLTVELIFHKTIIYYSESRDWLGWKA